jgi:glucose-6-phosphate isomerase
LSGLFAADPSRAKAFTIESGEILLDYSKHRIDAETMRLLAALAVQAQLPQWIAKMFAGDPINSTEERAALHVALRSRDAAFPEGRSVMAEVRGTRERVRRFVGEAHSGALKGASGRAIADVVNIGIGGSDLGPRMVTRALRAFRKPAPRLHFVSNIDPADLDATLAGLAPETTFFIVASKTFTTAETLANAERARAWLAARLGASADLSRHFAAVTANAAGAGALGVPQERVFPMWDWVGGRYSVWSAVGLAVALAVGMDSFEELLEGARAMDTHFRTEPVERNIPAVLALLEIWYVNFFGVQTRAVIPYCEDLRDLPAYLQQLEMESNGSASIATGRSRLRRPDRGVRRALPASIPFISSCTKARGWSPWISSSPGRPTRHLPSSRSRRTLSRRPRPSRSATPRRAPHTGPSPAIAPRAPSSSSASRPGR